MTKLLFKICKSVIGDEKSGVTEQSIIKFFQIMRIFVDRYIDENKEDTKDPDKKYWTQIKRWTEAHVYNDKMKIPLYELTEADKDEEARFKDIFRIGDIKQYMPLEEPNDLHGEYRTMF